MRSLTRSTFLVMFHVSHIGALAAIIFYHEVLLLNSIFSVCFFAFGASRSFNLQLRTITILKYDLSKKLVHITLAQKHFLRNGDKNCGK